MNTGNALFLDNSPRMLGQSCGCPLLSEMHIGFHVKRWGREVPEDAVSTSIVVQVDIALLS